MFKNPVVIKVLLIVAGALASASALLVTDPKISHALVAFGGYLAGSALQKRPGDVSFDDVAP